MHRSKSRHNKKQEWFDYVFSGVLMNYDYHGIDIAVLHYLLSDAAYLFTFIWMVTVFLII